MLFLVNLPFLILVAYCRRIWTRISSAFLAAAVMREFLASTVGLREGGKLGRVSRSIIGKEQTWELVFGLFEHRASAGQDLAAWQRIFLSQRA